MVWARMLAYITGTVDQELLLRNEYLAAERDRCAEPCSNTWPITTRSAITRASRTDCCSPCRIEGRAGITELCGARNDWVVC